MKCKACNGSKFVEVPEFEKQYTVCFSCGEVYSIKYVDLSKLKSIKIIILYGVDIPIKCQEEIEYA